VKISPSIIEITLNKITLPVLIVHGGADKLVGNDASRLFHDMISSVNKTIKIHPGLYHEVFNELGWRLVLRDVEQWIGSVL